MIKKFDEFNSKIKFVLHLNTDKQVAEALKMPISSYAVYKRENKIPYEQVIEVCKDKNIDLNWILNLKNL
jgi:UDP-glucose 4-epimerase